jgi:hypothetical protein
MIDVPKFVVMRFDVELGYWYVYSTHATYRDACDGMIRGRSKGETMLYHAGFAWIAGPGDDM